MHATQLSSLQGGIAIEELQVGVGSLTCGCACLLTAHGLSPVVARRGWLMAMVRLHDAIGGVVQASIWASHHGVCVGYEALLPRLAWLTTDEYEWSHGRFATVRPLLGACQGGEPSGCGRELWIRRGSMLVMRAPVSVLYLLYLLGGIAKEYFPQHWALSNRFGSGSDGCWLGRTCYPRFGG